MDLRDKALQSTMPAFMVPRFALFEPLATPGQRLLLASNGIWQEVCLPWMYIRVQVAPSVGIHVPYGAVEEELKFNFGKLPRAMVTQFIEIARGRSPNECAAWVVWNQATNAMRLLMLEETGVGHGHVNVNLPVLEGGEHMILDIHSHVDIPAFFSDEDNEDDKGGYKFAGVVGNINQERVTTVFRLCVNGLFINIPFNAYPEG